MNHVAFFTKGTLFVFTFSVVSSRVVASLPVFAPPSLSEPINRLNRGIEYLSRAAYLRHNNDKAETDALVTTDVFRMYVNLHPSMAVRELDASNNAQVYQPVHCRRSLPYYDPFVCLCYNKAYR